AEDRQTTRREDKAYSLLGIFSIHLPLIYSEKKEHAFRQLKKEIQNSLTGKYKMNRYIFSYILITIYKKISRIHSTNRVKAAYRTYGQQIPARIRSGLRIRRAGCYKTPTSRSLNIPTSNNSATTNRAGYSRLRATPAKARRY
ncbi:hypothetical protein BKA64DRAFT_571160, partial [Cadophora sp. MPI-SDFR-AT-0126]